VINEFKIYHGSALAELLDDADTAISIRRLDLQNNAIYILNDRVALYVKHSTARISPWRFSFTLEHVQDLVKLMTDHEDTYLVLVCGKDSIGVANPKQIGKLLNLKNPTPSWVSVQTGHNTGLTVEGSNGALREKLKKSRPFHEVKGKLATTIS
jgi:hypothetical protein